MLLQFTVENFRSFKTKCTLSLEPGNDETSDMDNHVAVIGREQILRTAVIFGPNAAGKSNIFKALTAAILLIRTSNTRQVGDLLLPIVPFLFSETTKEAPSHFEFVFMAQGTKYIYGFSATKRRIVTEYLYKYNSMNSVRPATIFERDADADKEYHFTNAVYKKELAPLIARNTANKLFLATATIWNSKTTAVPFSWFQMIDTYSSDYNTLFPKIVPLLQEDKDNSLKQFIRNMLHAADINIQDYSFESKDISDDEFFRHLPSQLVEMLPQDFKQSHHTSVNVKFMHHIDEKDAVQDGKDFSLELRDESNGTINLFMLSPILKQAFEEGRIVCIDEFDNSLHPMLVLYLVGLFHDPEINKANAQLIISSHTTELLSSRIMRRDQIYFVEKNQKTGTSELYSLDEFAPGASKDIRKAYLLGRYGAVPTIDDGELPW